MERQSILLAATGEEADKARPTLEAAGFAVHVVAPEANEWPASRAAIVDGAAPDATAFCRRWRGRSGGQDAPLVWLADAFDPLGRTAGWQAGADAMLVRPLAPGELAAQVARLLTWADERERLVERAGESAQINQTLVELYQQVDADFRIVRRIQRSCRPTNLPQVGRAHFAVSHRERAGSAGDFHNVVRVDEDHVAFLLGDVMGQSLTSSMLAVYLHQSIAPKDIHGQTYRIVAPDEVLARLNRNLATLGVPDPPLVRLTYAVLNGRDGSLSYSVAGHTPPMFAPSSGPAAMWRSSGPLLGLPDATFASRPERLQPGDRLLLYTDGLDGTTPDQADVLLAGCEALRHLPLASLVESLTQSLLAQTDDPDDFTMLGVEFV